MRSWTASPTSTPSSSASFGPSTVSSGADGGSAGQGREARASHAGARGRTRWCAAPPTVPCSEFTSVAASTAGSVGDPLGVRNPLLGGHLDRAVALPAVAGRLGDEADEAGRERDGGHHRADGQRGRHHRCAGEVDAPAHPLLDSHAETRPPPGPGRFARMTGSVTTDGAVGGASSGSGAVSRAPRRAVSATRTRCTSPSHAAAAEREQCEVDLEAAVRLEGPGRADRAERRRRDRRARSRTPCRRDGRQQQRPGQRRSRRSRLDRPSAAHTAFSSDRRAISRPSACVRVTSPASAATAANATRPRAATRAADVTSSRSVARVTRSSAVCPAPGSP